jgi:hypothetical protein
MSSLASRAIAACNYPTYSPFRKQASMQFTSLQAAKTPCLPVAKLTYILWNNLPILCTYTKLPGFHFSIACILPCVPIWLIIPPIQYGQCQSFCMMTTQQGKFNVVVHSNHFFQCWCFQIVQVSEVVQISFCCPLDCCPFVPVTVATVVVVNKCFNLKSLPIIRLGSMNSNKCQKVYI